MASGPKLNKTLCDFIRRQPLFFVATAARDGRVNLSPKGLKSLKIMDERRIVWLSLCVPRPIGVKGCGSL